MKLGWRTGCFVLLMTGAFSAVVRADGGAVVGELSECKGLPAHAKTTPLGDDAVYVSDQRVAFPHMEGGGCEVYSMAHPAARASGSFSGGTTAVAVQAARCSKDSCPIAVAVRDQANKLLAAARTDVNCNEGVELRPIRLFSDHDDLELVCRTSSGAGWSESHLLIEVKPGALTPFYLVETGSRIERSPAEKKAGYKPSCPVGSVKVEKLGDEKAGTRPLLRVVDPTSGELQDGRGTLPARQMAYDPAHHDVKPTGAPDVPTAVDAHAGCH